MQRLRNLYFYAAATVVSMIGVLAGPPGGGVASAVSGPVSIQLAAPIVGIAGVAGGGGYWEVASDGGVFAFGDAGYFGSMSGRQLDAPIVGIAGTPGGQGYDLVAADGGLFAFGNAPYFGSMGGRTLDAPIVGMAVTPTGGGYWEVAADGGLFAFGNAPYFGSMGGRTLGAPIVGMAVTPTGGGYWEVAADGGLFAFGNAPFDGAELQPQGSPVVAAATSNGGYYEAGSDGGVFAFGGAAFSGSESGQALGGPIVGMAADPGGGYWLVNRAGAVYALGAPYDGGLMSPTPVAATSEGPRIAAVALSQVGSTDPYAYGPLGSTWCAQFASWAWQQAGVAIPSTGEAVGIGTWALANGGTLLAPTAAPQVGDAVLWEWAGSSAGWPDAAGLTYANILHVNIVVAVLPGDEIVTVGGNESGAVRELGPFNAQEAGAEAFAGQAIYAYVQPPA